MQAENCVNYQFLLNAIKANSLSITKQEQSIIDIVEDNTTAIIVLSKTGRATQLVCKFKPNKKIFGVR